MNAISLLLCLAVSSLTEAKLGNDPPFKAVTASFFGVSVADMAASTQWYSQKLGLAVVTQTPIPAGGAVTVLEGGGLTVELIRLTEAAPRTGPASTRPELLHGIFKSGFVVKDLDKTIAQLELRGVPIAF